MGDSDQIHLLYRGLQCFPGCFGALIFSVRGKAVCNRQVAPA